MIFLLLISRVFAVGWFSPDQLNKRYNPFNHKDNFGSFRGEN